MILFGCDSCLTVVRFVDDPQVCQSFLEHSIWEGGYPCVRQCGAKMTRIPGGEWETWKSSHDEGILKLYELSMAELFRAMSGFGLPDELQVEPEYVKALLLSNPITDLLLQRSDSGRTVIKRLDLKNGLSIHLASSPRGATVYKITRGDQWNDK